MSALCLPCSCFERFKYGPDEIDQYQKSKKIDKMLELDKRNRRKLVKLLLLGAGESGKSTFLKQMRIIHGLNFDDETIAEYRLTIYQNIVKGMKVLVDARDKLDIPWQDPSRSEYGNHLLRYENSYLDKTSFSHYAGSVKELWKDHGIKTAFYRRREFQLVSICITNDLICGNCIFAAKNRFYTQYITISEMELQFVSEVSFGYFYDIKRVYCHL